MVIIEGLDGTGKSTLALEYEKKDMKIIHFSYDSGSEKLFEKYCRTLDYETSKVVLDRSFISEMVYGPIVRNYCRINWKEFLILLEKCKMFEASLIYLEASKDELLKRRYNTKDFRIIERYYDELCERYKRIIDISSQYIPTSIINTEGSCI